MPIVPNRKSWYGRMVRWQGAKEARPSVHLSKYCLFRKSRGRTPGPHVLGFLARPSYVMERGRPVAMVRNTFPSLACLRPRKYITSEFPVVFVFSLFPPWLTMQSTLGKRKREPSTTKPEKSKPIRDRELAEYIISLKTVAMVSCTHCINNGVECYYSREQSVSCAECILKHRKCDGSFSLEELRKVGELKKAEQKKRRVKLQEAAKLRAALVASQRALLEAQQASLKAQEALAAAEEEQAGIDESIAELDDRTERMLKREMLALGVFDRVSDEQEVALGDGDMSWLDHNFHVQQVDWASMWPQEGSLGSS